MVQSRYGYAPIMTKVANETPELFKKIKAEIKLRERIGIASLSPRVAYQVSDKIYIYDNMFIHGDSRYTHRREKVLGDIHNTPIEPIENFLKTKQI